MMSWNNCTPSRLTPFEEYMLLDDRPGWPMTFWIRMRFNGPLDVDRLGLAMAATSARHPLLSARIMYDSRSRPCWIPSTPLGIVRRFDGDSTETLPAVEPFDLTEEAPWRLWINSASNDSEAWLEFHHAACDGAGAFQAIDDLLKAYVERKQSPANHAVGAWDQLAVRGRCDTMVCLGDQLGQWMNMLSRMARYMLLVPTSLDSLNSSANGAGAEWTQSVGTAEYRVSHLGPIEDFQETAHRAGCTINDLILEALFAELGELFAIYEPDRSQRLRIFVPMDLRGNPVNTCAVCNVVGMVHIDRVTGPHGKGSASLFDVADEMRVYRFYRTGRVFDVVLQFACWLLDSPRPLLCADKCGATTILSNLNTPLHNSDLIGEDGRLHLDSTTLEELDVFPPVRRRTPATFVTWTYAHQLHLSLQFKPCDFERAHADFLLDGMTRRLRSSISSVRPLVS